MLKIVHKDLNQIANKIAIATEGAVRNQFVKRLAELPNKANALNIANFLIAAKTESNISDRYKEDLIFILCKISDYVGKNFTDCTREDLLSYLDIHRKTEAADPLHKWIGSYNLHRVYIVKFFRWLYAPDIEAKERPKPSCIENIPELKRKEKSIYKPSDLWSVDDDLLFLKFCPSKRDRCYHAISRDLSCRPHELLKLKIQDVTFKMAGNTLYAEVTVNGKTGQRHIPLINSIPFLKEWLSSGHPFPGNPNSPLICGFNKSLGRAINYTAMHGAYEAYKTKVFPKLLEDPSVTPEDKNHIRDLLKKPWNPYLIGRHTSLTQKSKILREHVLRQHAGWTQGSTMPQVYLHYFGNENSEELLEAYGLKPKKEEVDKLKPKQCPNCGESCKVNDRFCPKCRMVLSYDSYMESVKGTNEQAGIFEEIKQRLANLEQRYNKSS